MTDLAKEVARAEARQARLTPKLIELLVDQAKWIDEILDSGDLPRPQPMCGCSICERTLRGERLRERYQKLRPG